MKHNLAQRRYAMAVILLMLAYILILFGVGTYFNNSAPTGPLAYAAAILPALPVVGVFWAMGRYLIDERDEYLRAQVVRQCLIATGFALSLATIWGFLESFELVRHVDSYFVAILWFAGLGLGSCVNKLMQPRAEGEPA